MEFLTEDYKETKKVNEKDSKSRAAFINSVLHNIRGEDKKLIESTFGTNREMEIDEEKVDKLV